MKQTQSSPLSISSLKINFSALVIRSIRWLRLKSVLKSLVSYTPQAFQKWVENVKLNDSYSNKLVPEKEITQKYREAFLLLGEKQKPETLGDYLEFGVCHGTSMVCLHKVLQELNLKQVRLFGFDSFEGLPETARNDDGGAWFPGQFNSSLELTSKILTEQGIDWNRTFLVKGWFSETLNQDLVEKYQLTKASVIMVDCDMYLSAKEALNFCAPLIQEEAIIFFDDWYSQNLDQKNMGEKRAFDEFLQENPHFGTEKLGSYTANAQIFRVFRK
ncbi:MAG: class I SAM-dependent methyltransferase [Symploca sp. SIO2D2]|nr:class I SAM-dependent methyltransferase [Symploca sp. SIO2D2]